MAFAIMWPKPQWPPGLGWPRGRLIPPSGASKRGIKGNKGMCWGWSVAEQVSLFPCIGSRADALLCPSSSVTAAAVTPAFLLPCSCMCCNVFSHWVFRGSWEGVKLQGLCFRCSCKTCNVLLALEQAGCCQCI